MVAHVCPVKRSHVIFYVLVTFSPLLFLYLRFVLVAFCFCFVFSFAFSFALSFAFSFGCFSFRLYFCFGCFLFNLICLLPLLLSPSPSQMHPSMLCTNRWWWLYVNGAGAKMTMPAPKRCVIVIVATPLISRTIWSEQQLNQFLQDMLHNPPSIYLRNWPIMSFHSFSPFLWTICLKTIYLYLACKFHTPTLRGKMNQVKTTNNLCSPNFCDFLWQYKICSCRTVGWARE